MKNPMIVADAQDWDDTVLLKHLLDWIGQDQYRNRDASYYLQQIADAENERGFEVEVVFQVIATNAPDAIRRVENQLAILEEGHDNPVIPWTIDERGTVEADKPSLDDVEPHKEGTLGAFTRDHPILGAHSKQDNTHGEGS